MGLDWFIVLTSPFFAIVECRCTHCPATSNRLEVREESARETISADGVPGARRDSGRDNPSKRTHKLRRAEVPCAAEKTELLLPPPPSWQPRETRAQKLAAAGRGAGPRLKTAAER